MRLIDADELLKHKFKSASERMDLSVEYMGGWNDAIDSINENAPIIDAEPTINEKKIIKDFLLKCSKICNDDCDKCPMYIQRAYDEKLCFFDFFDNFQFLDNVKKMDDVITGVLDYEIN